MKRSIVLENAVGLQFIRCRQREARTGCALDRHLLRVCILWSRDRVSVVAQNGRLVSVLYQLLKVLKGKREIVLDGSCLWVQLWHILVSVSILH